MNKGLDINIVCDEDLIFNRLRYTLDFINNHPLAKGKIFLYLNAPQKSSVNLYYSSKSDEKPWIPAQLNFFSNKKGVYEKLYANGYKQGEEVIFSVENKKKKEGIFYQEGKFGFDILETIFYHISRYEEVFWGNRFMDRHRRMKMQHQILPANSLHHRPVVDILVTAFLLALEIDVPDVPAQYSLTHDIDIIRKYNSVFKSAKSLVNAIRLGFGWRGFLKIARSILRSTKDNTQDPYYTYSWLFDDRNKYRHKVVYFVTGGSTRWDLYNKNYLKEMPSIIKMALAKSYNIGLHPSYKAFDDKKKLWQQYYRLKKILNRDIVYIRTHYLRLDIMETFKLFEELGIRYDSTLGYADDIGFRCGTGFEYYPYNFAEERAWSFKEIPLVVMDSALFYGVCGADVKCFKQKLDKFLRQNKYNTHITFNFHNATFDDSVDFTRGLKEVYLTLLNSL